MPTLGNHSRTANEGLWHEGLEGLAALQQHPCFSGFKP
jgi:hypothetical protein